MGDDGDGDRERAWELFLALTMQPTINLLYLDHHLEVRDARWHQAAYPGLTVRAGQRLADVVHPDDYDDVAAAVRTVLATGQTAVSTEHRVWHLWDRETGRAMAAQITVMWSPYGAVMTVINHQAQEAARRHLDVVSTAAATTGTSLDVRTTAQQLADAVLPLCDRVMVFLSDKLETGEEPPRRIGAGDLEIVVGALAPRDADWPDGLLRPGGGVPIVPDTAAVRMYQEGRAMTLFGAAQIHAAIGNDPELIRLLVPYESTPGDVAHAVATIATSHLVLGAVQLWRTGEPFTDDELQALREAAALAAGPLNNSRLYTRERLAVLTLQQSLLPAVAATTAADCAGRYLPAEQGGVGGDWYDVIPLSSARLGLVVGDVVGHGLPAATMMGRMRTAVQTLADMDLTPDELLTHLDDLVGRLARAGDEAALCCTCLYAVLDPVAGRLSVASAGHPPPLLRHPDGTTAYLPIDPGPPLGVGGLPFEVTEATVPAASVLALYTDGLVHSAALDLDVGMEALRQQLADTDPRADLDAAADALVSTVPAAADDVTLLLAHARPLPADATAVWDVPPDPAAVAALREQAARQLAAWETPGDICFTAELVVSELVTNAMRYGGGPARLRLIRDQDQLIIEVADPSSTAPHLRRARDVDEGGRGLYICAQVCTAWGTRFGDVGKTIWAALGMTAVADLDEAPPPDLDAFPDIPVS